VPEPARELAYEELLIAEGSDWCWWYGPEHNSDNRPEFDQLYRDHLANVYRALNLTIPEALSNPILKHAQEGDLHVCPTNALDVTLDGEVTSAFEWMGAGHVRPDPRSGSMHGNTAPAREMFYGFRDGRVFVRLDGPVSGASFTIEFDGATSETRSARGRVAELEAPVTGERFRIVATCNGLAPITRPENGWIDVA
jgi:hypothetical protein